MLAAKSALRKWSRDSGPAILHMRSVNDKNRKQRHTVFPGTIDYYDAAGHRPTEIVMCMQWCCLTIVVDEVWDEAIVKACRSSSSCF
jgi:hypothetical protein